ncbi:MAG: deoxyribonuclease IV [Longispora sp.]|nr:deoxyribonuclease IV [Longispora sp. (in: high G+C Gram-positive bacteria)]
MRIGAHVNAEDPLAEAGLRSAEVVQFFLADPQGWKAPGPRKDADTLRDSDVDIYIHAPYVINVATSNNRVRIPSRKLLMAHASAAAEVGAKGLVVHGGQVSAGEDLTLGFDNWRKALAFAEEEGGLPVPLLIENTAGGNHSCARRFDDLARLWDALDGYDVGLCLDTCHAYAGGEELAGIVERLMGITGRIDLIHANGSKFGFNSGRDRHENFARGEIDPELIAEVVRTAGADAVCETPGSVEDQSADIEFLRKHAK